jgi:hypothetical protein
VVRFSYNRFQENPEYKLNEIEDIVKSKMNNIELLDSSMIKVAVNKAKGIKKEKAIFGGRWNFIQRILKKITKEEWLKTRNMPVMLRGSSADNNGNRKAELHIIEDNSVLIKLNKDNHFSVTLPRLNKEQKRNLCFLQTLCEENRACFSLEISNEYIYIIFDENILKKENPDCIKDRILSFDMNPNYIGLSIIDWKNENEKTIIHKEIISLKEINDLEKSKYQTNKRKHETMHISKYIIGLAKYHKVETVSFEKLNMPSSNKKKGKNYNKLVNNYWLRSPLINNIKKRCNIENIRFQGVIPHYSSFIGQLNNPQDYDSIAASIEISRRSYLFIKMYIEQTKTIGNIVFPEFNVGFLNLHWKDRLGDILNNIDSWKSLYLWFKKSKSSYRLLFSPELRKDSLSLNSANSCVYRYICA